VQRSPGTEMVMDDEYVQNPALLDW
jgi:hypothetical protein